MNTWAFMVLAVVAATHGYEGPMNGHYGWNSTTSEADEFEDYFDELEDPEEPFAPSERGKPKKSDASLTFDFEKKGNRLQTYFSAENSERSLSQSFYKNGDNSLLWKWKDIINGAEKPKLTLDLFLLQRNQDEVKRGGIKFWIYKESKSPNSKMQIVFHGPSKDATVKGSITSKPTDVNLDFKGWRGIWIAYREFNANDFHLKKLKKIEFIIQSTKADKLYFDLIQFSKSIGYASRDLVVSKVGQSDPGKDDAPFHDDKDFWQQTLRWNQYQFSKYTETLENVNDKLEDIKTIENRIENWYAKEDESIIRLADRDSSISSRSGIDDGFNLNKMKVKRWKSLQTAIQQAHVLYQKIDFQKRRPSLFPKRSDYGKEEIKVGSDSMTKFGYIFAKILLPLSLECALKSRKVEVEYLAKKVCNDLSSGTDGEAFNKGIQDVAGESKNMIEKFKEIVKTFKNKNTIECPPEDSRALDIEKLIQQFYDYLYQRIKILLEYLQDQGIGAGSSLGSLDHEMNKIGSGFVHSVFLLRNRLREDPMFDSLVDAMKWYSDFNEIYQPDDDFVYDGTTTDRMRTILLYRLQIILMKKTKGQDEIHDLNHLRKWAKHALKINKGFGGVIKPDFTGFHHKTFYGSAYVPQAYHNAALVQYFLDGTSFEFDTNSKANLRKALSVLRMVSVKFSTPNGVCGRFPGYDRAILARILPAYAYISYVHPKDGAPEGVYKPEIFLRLFDLKNPSVIEYLERGAPRSHIYYWNTIGCLDLLKKISTLKCENNKVCTAEKAPSGHWSKNFASLSIHRRKDWAVAVKGFGKYDWDFEGTTVANAYGVFQSHGSLQISNSEESLKSYDVQNGWDWTKVPGSTTVASDDFDQIRVKARNYNFQGFAGGVSFFGSRGVKIPQQGAFGMLFKKPEYKIPKEVTNSPLLNLLEFRKSFFFYNHLIVCLGSNIQFEQTTVDGIYPQTTLFQDKKLNGNSKISIGKKQKVLGEKYEKSWSQEKDPVVLEDSKGNTYQIKLIDHSTLKVKISKQKSRKSNGADESSAWYGTAWIDHTKESTTSKRNEILRNNFEAESSFVDHSISSESIGDFAGDTNNFNPNETDEHLQDSSTDTSKYQYAIVIKGGSTDQLNKYKVIQQDKQAHIIQLNSQFSDSADKVYAYSFFESHSGKAVCDEGPIKRVNAPCMIMAEKRFKTLRLAISNHDMGFEYDPLNNKKATCNVKLKGNTNVFRPKASRDVGVKTMFCVRGKTSKIAVRLCHDVASVKKVIVNGEEKNGEAMNKFINVRRKRLVFSNLVNGFTTEVVLELK